MVKSTGKENKDKLPLNASLPTSIENLQEQEVLEDDYQFFRALVKRNIFKLSSVKEQRVMSTWLHNCDIEEDKSVKCLIVKMMLVSLQRMDGPLVYFKETGQAKLPEEVNTDESLFQFLVKTLNAEDDPNNYDSVDMNIRQTVSAVVSADLTSCASTFRDDNCVLAFYARSDYVINTWILPEHVQFPLYSRSSARWESALSTLPITSRSSQAVIPKSEEHINNKLSDTIRKESLVDIQCGNLNIEQESIPALGVKEKFKWYEHSKLDGSLRPIHGICIDKDTCLHDKNQLDMDERAISVGNRVYPGRLRMILDPMLITEVTGIKVNKPGKGLNTHENTLIIDAIDCIKTRSQITINGAHRPYAGEDRNVDIEPAIDQTTIPDGTLDIGVLCGQSKPRSKQSCIDTQEIDTLNDGKDLNADKTMSIDQTTTPETETGENINEICEKIIKHNINGELCSVLVITKSVMSTEDRSQIIEDECNVDKILIRADQNISQEVIIPEIDGFCELILKPSSEPSNNHSLGSPKEQLNDEKKLCADTITMEADYLTINSKVQSEISDFHRQVSDTCCEPSSSDSLVVNDSSVNSVGDKPSDREDNLCTNLVTMEPNRDVIQVATSDISELCLKVSELCDEMTNSDSLANPKNDWPNIGNAKCVDTITIQADQKITRVGPDIGEFCKQKINRRTTAMSKLSPWQVDYSIQLSNSPSETLQLSPATVVVRRSSKCLHSSFSSSSFKTNCPRISIPFRRRYYMRFSAGSDNLGRRWLSAGNNCCVPQYNNPAVAGQQMAIWEANNQQPRLPPLRSSYRNTSTPNAGQCQPQQPRRQMTDHSCGQVQPYNNPLPVRQLCNNLLPALPQSKNPRRDRRATCMDLPALNPRPCTPRYTCNALLDQPFNGGPNFIRRGTNRNTTFTVTGSINIVADTLPAQPPSLPCRSNTVEPLENYLNADMAIPRNIAVPDCPFVSIDENVPDRNTPEHWRNPFIPDDNGGNVAENWRYQQSIDSLGSAPMSIDISPVFNEVNGYLQDVDDPVFTTQHELRNASYRPRTGSVSRGPCGRRQPNSFYRNTR